VCFDPRRGRRCLPELGLHPDRRRCCTSARSRGTSIAAAEIGITVPQAVIDRAGVAGFKDKVVKANVGGVNQLFKANGVTFAYGDASFQQQEHRLAEEKGRLDRRSTPRRRSSSQPARRPVDVKAWPRDGDTIIQFRRRRAGEAHPEEFAGRRGRRNRARSFATVYTRLGAKVLVVEALVADSHRNRQRDLQDARPHPQEAGRRDRARHQGDGAREERATRPSRRRSTARTRATKRNARVRHRCWWRSDGGRSPTPPTLARGGSRDQRQRLHRTSMRSAAPRLTASFAIGDVTGAPLLAHKADEGRGRVRLR